MGIDPEIMLSLSFWLFISGIVGARLFYVIEYWDDFQGETIGDTLKAVLNVTQGGLVVYGSFLAGAAAFFYFLYRHRLPALAIGDLIAPSLMIGLAFGRIGCLLNGCCFGGQCDLPWAVTFPEGSPPFQRQVSEQVTTIHGVRFEPTDAGPAKIASIDPDSPAAAAGLKPGESVAAIQPPMVGNSEQQKRPLKVDGSRHAAELLSRSFEAHDTFRIILSDNQVRSLTPSAAVVRSAPVHPTQVYSAINATLLGLFLIAYYPYRRRDGELVAMIITLYPITRFLLEIIRRDEHAVFGTGLSISQNVSVTILAIAAVLWIYLSRQPRGSVLPIGRASGRAAPAVV